MTCHNQSLALPEVKLAASLPILSKVKILIVIQSHCSVTRHNIQPPQLDFGHQSTVMAHDDSEATPPADINSDSQNSKSGTNITFPLLHLPGELILRVLHFAVVASSKCNPIRLRMNEESSPGVTQPAITRTCRLLGKEGLATFYKQNVFFSDSAYYSRVSGLYEWLIRIGSDNRAAIGQIHVYWVNGDVDDLMDRTLDDLMREVDFILPMQSIYKDGLVKGMLQREKVEVCLRFREGKLVIGAGDFDCCYQLMLRRPDDTFRYGWTSGEKFIETYDYANDNYAGESPIEKSKLESRDFWVHDV